ncbi:ABC transporter ATP-binding protein [Paraburkholderia sp. HD33-4]|uniref:ABC transporter ATP-binding protein n=1 Tax=Paraburkholderia sp. HD33-4 TaxID=2883242 RepID=UPI001F2C6EBB|nr:ABC transporter ATP-binding protein [Paraburkholderia sp. HD33-4]
MDRSNIEPLQRAVDAAAASGDAVHVTGLEAWYGESHILHGVDLRAARGEVVTLLGRNGAGRSTTLKAIMGLTDRRRGSIVIDGRETVGMPPQGVARLGVGYCPEERGIFAGLSCEENLMLPPRLPRARGTPMSLDEIYEMFPNLAERRASQGTRLSGGEQQMLAIARILRTGADILLLDEISEGLAPVIVQTLARVIRVLKSRGFTVLLVEQNFRFAAPLADRFYVMEHGRIVDTFEAARLHEKAAALQALLNI